MLNGHFQTHPDQCPQLGRKCLGRNSLGRRVRVQRVGPSLPSALAHEVRVVPRKSPWMPFHVFLGEFLTFIKSSPGPTRESPPAVSWCMSWCEATQEHPVTSLSPDCRKCEYQQECTITAGLHLPVASAPSSWGSLWVVPAAVASPAGSALVAVPPPLLVPQRSPSQGWVQIPGAPSHT